MWAILARIRGVFEQGLEEYIYTIWNFIKFLLFIVLSLLLLIVYNIFIVIWNIILVCWVDKD
jgi:hypothetical protein